MIKCDRINKEENGDWNQKESKNKKEKWGTEMFELVLPDFELEFSVKQIDFWFVFHFLFRFKFKIQTTKA